MAGTISMGGVGAGLSQAQFQLQYATRSLKEQTNSAKAVGAVALELVRSVMASSDPTAQQHDLDVNA